MVAACIDITIQQRKINGIDDPIFNYLITVHCAILTIHELQQTEKSQVGRI